MWTDSKDLTSYVNVKKNVLISFKTYKMMPSRIFERKYHSRFQDRNYELSKLLFE